MVVSSVALCLLTCDRPAYTVKTLESLVRHNPDLSKFTLLHGDDASRDTTVFDYIRSLGFKTVIKSVERSGVISMERSLAFFAAAHQCHWTFLLQNDWEFVRAFPWDLFDHAIHIPNVYCVRMYGVQKDRGKRVSGNRHKGKGGSDPGWSQLMFAPEPAELGSIHWCSPPAVTKTSVLCWLLQDAQRDRDARIKSGELNYLTVRPINNVVYHFGEDRTPGFKS